MRLAAIAPFVLLSVSSAVAQNTVAYLMLRVANRAEVV